MSYTLMDLMRDRGVDIDAIENPGMFEAEVRSFVRERIAHELWEGMEDWERVHGNRDGITPDYVLGVSAGYRAAINSLGEDW